MSIARRLQDPLAELVKIDPKAIGVGQYQHDVNQTQLSQTLDAVVEDCVNAVAATVSIGVAASRIGGHDLGGLLGRADSALYQAKEAGRNRVAAFAGDSGACDAPLVPAAA